MARETIGIGTIDDDGTGDNLRVGGGKINDNFTEIYGERGWGYYQDGLITTPTITVTTSFTQLTIDSAGVLTNESYLPRDIRGSLHLWSGNKITPVNTGDDYDGRLDIEITGRTGSPTYIEFIIDIGNSTPDTNRIFTGYMLSTNATPYRQNLPFDFYSLTTFVSNGGKIYARVDTGTVTIGSRALKISRKFSGLT